MSRHPRLAEPSIGSLTSSLEAEWQLEEWYWSLRYQIPLKNGVPSSITNDCSALLIPAKLLSGRRKRLLSFCLPAADQGSNRWLWQAGGQSIQPSLWQSCRGGDYWWHAHIDRQPASEMLRAQARTLKVEDYFHWPDPTWARSLEALKPAGKGVHEKKSIVLIKLQAQAHVNVNSPNNFGASKRTDTGCYSWFAIFLFSRSFLTQFKSRPNFMHY